MTQTKMCDMCEEEYEDAFFCSACSRLYCFDGEVELKPGILWCGSPKDEYVLEEREPEWRDVCGNCCMGHRNAA